MFLPSRGAVLTLLALLITAFVAASAPAQIEETTLAWKFQKGQKYDQQLRQNTITTLSLAGQETKTETTLTTNSTWTIEDVDTLGTATIVQRFARVRFSLTTAAAPVEFDTDSTQEPKGLAKRIAPALNLLAAATFTLKMTPRAEIQDIQLSEGTAKGFNELPAAQTLGGLFSPDSLTNMFKQGAQPFPLKPLKKGDKWSSSTQTKVQGLGKMNTVSKLTYAGPTDVDGKSLERIDVNVKAVVDSEEASGQTVLRKQTATGTIFFDNKAGHLSNWDFNQSMTMDVQVVGTTVEQQIDQHVTVHIVPSNGATE